MTNVETMFATDNGRVHLIITGYVQGVFFRASTKDTAYRLGLTGWVRNLPDGNVEAVFEGPRADLKQAVAESVSRIVMPIRDHFGERNDLLQVYEGDV